MLQSNCTRGVQIYLNCFEPYGLLLLFRPLVHILHGSNEYVTGPNLKSTAIFVVTNPIAKPFQCHLHFEITCITKANTNRILVSHFRLLAPPKIK